LLCAPTGDLDHLPGKDHRLTRPFSAAACIPGGNLKTPAWRPATSSPLRRGQRCTDDSAVRGATAAANSPGSRHGAGVGGRL